MSVLNKNNNLIRVLRGPQHDYFSDSSKKDFCSKNYKISNLTDRMGMRLEGTFLKNVVSTNIRSEGIVKGSVQVPADGQPIVLLNDHPTIGGYPKIANVISADYDSLIQNTRAIAGYNGGIFFKLWRFACKIFRRFRFMADTFIPVSYTHLTLPTNREV